MGWSPTFPRNCKARVRGEKGEAVRHLRFNRQGKTNINQGSARSPCASQLSALAARGSHSRLVARLSFLCSRLSALHVRLATLVSALPYAVGTDTFSSLALDDLPQVSSFDVDALLSPLGFHLGSARRGRGSRRPVGSGGGLDIPDQVIHFCRKFCGETTGRCPPLP